MQSIIRIIILILMLIIPVSSQITQAEAVTPQPFNLISPENNATIINPTSGAFTWQESTNATDYLLLVVALPGQQTVFDSGALASGEVCVTQVCSLTYDFGQLADGNYLFLVHAGINEVFTVMSNQLHQFSILREEITPQPFNLIFPAEGGSITEPTVDDFTWQQSVGATDYVLILNTALDAPVFESDVLNVAEVCSEGVCRLSYDFSQLPNGGYRFQVIAGVDGVFSVASNAPHLFHIARVEPDFFNLLSPLEGETIAPATTTAFTWEHATNATEYLLFLNTSGNIPVFVSDLLDAVDVCADGVCAMPYDFGQLIQGNSYRFQVVAGTNGLLTRPANDPHLFTVDDTTVVPQPFDLLTPAEGAVMTNPTTGAFTWGQSANATDYLLFLNTADNETVFTSDVLFADDICANQVCSLSYDFGQLADGDYRFQVVAGLDSVFSKPANAPHLFTVSRQVIVDGELLTNGDFETPNAGEWKLKNGAKIKCNTLDKTFTPFGACAVMLKMGTKTVQKIDMDAVSIEADDTIILTGMYRSKGTFKVAFVGTHADGTRDKLVIKVTENTAGAYLPIDRSTVITDTLVSAKLVAKSVQGKIFFDDMSLELDNGNKLAQPAPSASSLIDVPQAPDAFRR